MSVRPFRWAINRRNFRQEIVVESETSSTRTALVLMQTKRHKYVLDNECFHL